MTAAIVYAAGAVAALATLLMLFTRDAVKAAMLMLTALLSTAAIYLALSAQLLAALQTILYAGAIMTLFIVAISVTPQAVREKVSRGRLTKVLGLAAAAVLLTELLKITAVLKPVSVGGGFSETSALDIARLLFGPYVLQFELLSLLVLSAIVGAVALAGKREGGA